MKKKYLSYYFKMLISMSFAFLVPFLIDGFLLYSIFINTLDNEISRIGESFLKQSVPVVDTRFEEMNRLALYVSQLSFPSGNHSNYFDVWSKYQEIKSLLAMNLFIQDFYIFLSDNDTVYSTSWAIKRPYFLSSIKIKNISVSDHLEKFLENITEMSVFSPAEVTNNLIQPSSRYSACIYPLSQARLNNQGCILFFLSQDALDNILNVKAVPHKINLLVYEKNGSLVYSTGENVQALSGIVSAYHSFDKLPTHVHSGEQNLSIYKMVSAINGWTYIAAVSNESVKSKLYILKITLVLSFVGILFFGVLILIVLTRLNYRPISEILSYVATSSYGSVDKFRRYSFWRNQNEFSIVRSAFSTMSSTIEDLRHQLEYWRFNIKESLIADLLNGKYLEISDFNRAALSCGMQLEENYFVVIAIMAYHRICFDNEGLLLRVEEMLYQDFRLKGYGALLPPGNHLAFIISGNGLTNKDVFNEFLHRIKVEFFPANAIGVGSICHSIKDIGLSYIKAVSATDYHFFQEKSNIIYFDRLSVKSSHTNYLRYIEALENALTAGNTTASSLVLDELFKIIRNKKMPVFQIKTVIYNILTMIKRLSDKMRYPLSDELLKDTDIFMLSGFNQLVDIDVEGFIRKLICEICEEIKKRGLDNDLASRVNEYINQNYSDLNLSIQSIADHFGYSASNLAHNYKNITGNTVLNYIRNYRIARAKELLESSSSGIQEIGVVVGYDSLVTFVRNFRQCTGLTPNEYREKNKKLKKARSSNTRFTEK